MDVIVRTVSRMLFPFIIVFGAYIAFHGHLSPGGGFPAGVIIATGFALIVIAYEQKHIEKIVTENFVAALKSVSGIILLSVILLGAAMRFGLLMNQNIFELWSGGYTPFLNLAGSLMVATGLVMIIYNIVRE